MAALIVEVVERARDGAGRGGAAPAWFWGLVFNVEDIDRVSSVRRGSDRRAEADAVQPGRRIATVRAELGLGLPVALMSMPVR